LTAVNVGFRCCCCPSITSKHCSIFNYYLNCVVDVGSAEGLAYDEFFQEIYWTSYTNSSINRINVNLQRSRRDPEKIVQLSAEDHPRAIVIDSCQSYVFTVSSAILKWLLSLVCPVFCSQNVSYCVISKKFGDLFN